MARRAAAAGTPGEAVFLYVVFALYDCVHLLVVAGVAGRADAAGISSNDLPYKAVDTSLYLRLHCVVLRVSWLAGCGVCGGQGCCRRHLR
jgi:hypothetical protein